MGAVRLIFLDPLAGPVAVAAVVVDPVVADLLSAGVHGGIFVVAVHVGLVPILVLVRPVVFLYSIDDRAYGRTGVAVPDDPGPVDHVVQGHEAVVVIGGVDTLRRIAEERVTEIFRVVDGLPVGRVHADPHGNRDYVVVCVDLPDLALQLRAL